MLRPFWASFVPFPCLISDECWAAVAIVVVVVVVMVCACNGCCTVSEGF